MSALCCCRRLFVPLRSLHPSWNTLKTKRIGGGGGGGHSLCVARPPSFQSFCQPITTLLLSLDAGSRLSFFLRHSRISPPSRLSTMHVFGSTCTTHPIPIPSFLPHPPTPSSSLFHTYHLQPSPIPSGIALILLWFCPLLCLHPFPHPIPMPRTHARSSWNFSGPP